MIVQSVVDGQLLSALWLLYHGCLLLDAFSLRHSAQAPDMLLSFANQYCASLTCLI